MGRDVVLLPGMSSRADAPLLESGAPESLMGISPIAGARSIRGDFESQECTTGSVALPGSLSELGVEPFLAALVKCSDDAIIGKTPDGRVVFWNAAAERLYGYRAEEMLGRTIAMLIPSDRPEELPQLLADVREGRTVTDFHTERLRKDGAIVPVAITVSPVIGDDGAIVGASTIAHDLSAHVEQVKILSEAERRTAEALSLLATLQACAPVGLAFIDREFRILHINEMLAAVNGSSVQNQIGKTLIEVIPDIWPQIEGVYRHVLENDEAVLNIEVSGEIAADPGHRHHWLANYYPVHLDNEVIGAGVVVIDVTERRQAEEFRSIAMNQMVEGLFTVDVQGRLTSMNASAARMLGWKEQELLGQEMRCLVLAHGGGESVEEGNQELLKVRSEGRHVQLDDHVYCCKNGSLLPVAISASPLFIGSSIEGAVVVFRDITDEKSERLRVSRELAALTWVGRIREALDENRLILFHSPLSLSRGDDQVRNYCSGWLAATMRSLLLMPF
jgi:two-component system, NtrC family, sensor kinase